jgi:hypothetical protein
MNDEVRAGHGGSGLRGIGMMQQGEVELREVSRGWAENARGLAPAPMRHSWEAMWRC